MTLPIFDQFFITFKGFTCPVMLIEKGSFWLFIDSTFKTYYKSFILITLDLLSIIQKKRLKRYDHFVDLSWSEFIENWRSHQGPFFSVVVDKVAN